MAINLFVIIFLIILFVLFLKNVGRIIPRRNLPWILGGYFTVLVASILILPMLPKVNFPVTVSEKGLEQAKRGYIDLPNAAIEGRPEQIKGVSKLKQWEFNFSGKQLQIAGANNYGLRIIADQKGTSDGKIEVTYYATKTLLEGIDVTNDIKPPNVSLAGNRLVITMPEQYKVEIAKFDKDFVIAQLLRDSRGQEMHNIMGAQVLYLRVPQEVLIEDTKMGLQFVTKE